MPLHHLALGGKNLPTLAQFYREVAELEFLRESRNQEGIVTSIWLDLSPGILMIELSAAKREPVSGRGSGLFLLAFPLRDEALFRARLNRLRIPIEEESQSTIYLRDPEDNRVAFSLHPKKLKSADR